MHVDILYHGWSTNSIDIPTEFLCIIHDKMDHTKTTILRMQRNTKATAGLGQIPISITRMLVHGHSDRVYPTMRRPSGQGFEFHYLINMSHSTGLGETHCKGVKGVV
jgi:hypothetical protein